LKRRKGIPGKKKQIGQATKHARKQAWDRYGFKLTPEVHQDFIKQILIQIKENKRTAIKKSSHTRNVYLVTYRGKNSELKGTVVKVMYSKTSKTIITCLSK